MSNIDLIEKDNNFSIVSLKKNELELLAQNLTNDFNSNAKLNWANKYMIAISQCTCDNEHGIVCNAHNEAIESYKECEKDLKKKANAFHEKRMELTSVLDQIKDSIISIGYCFSPQKESYLLIKSAPKFNEITKKVLEIRAIANDIAVKKEQKEQAIAAIKRALFEFIRSFSKKTDDPNELSNQMNTYFIGYVEFNKNILNLINQDDVNDIFNKIYESEFFISENSKKIEDYNNREKSNITANELVNHINDITEAFDPKANELANNIIENFQSKIDISLNDDEKLFLNKKESSSNEQAAAEAALLVLELGGKFNKTVYASIIRAAEIILNKVDVSSVKLNHLNITKRIV